MYPAIILGTRPEIIKMSPVIWECEKRSIPYFILHTGQHYTPNMDELFFKELALPMPKYNLGLGELSYRKQVGLFIKNIGRVLLQEKPDVVLVQGDTISVVAGALSANKLGIKVAHHEAGLRSHDVTMLEEVNRTITDHVSEFLFTPTTVATKNLIEEGFNEKRIFFTGNTIVDVINRYLPTINQSTVLLELGLRPKQYFLVTAHRAENVDNRERLDNIFKGLALVQKSFPDFEIVFPMHPRTKKRSKDFGISLPNGIRVIDPVGYFFMLALEKNARLIFTDSGGIQEEACVLRVPVITMRDNTERPETVEFGFNILAPQVNPDDILQKAKEMMTRKFTWSNPFGDGYAGERIVDLLAKNFD